MLPHVITVAGPKPFELYHFQSPRGRKAVQGNKFTFGRKVRHSSSNTIW